MRFRGDSTGRIIPAVNRKNAFLAAALLLGIGTAAAHPMGNFSISRWTKLTVRAGGVDLVHLIDFAEVPTQVEFAVARLTQEPKGQAAERFRDALAGRYQPGLHLETGGKRVPLTLTKASLEFVSGTAGLPTVRLTLDLAAPLPAGDSDLSFSDTNFEGRAGWKEIVAAAANGATLLSSSVPAADRSRMLTSYPSDPAEPPSEVTSARLRVRIPGV